ncbi:MAG TPA: rod shape-determining protein MreC [Coxiellaceae bacterium]|nr:MAG: rod shape-determining protein MreC [Gammaproteobacteria bacterium RIFCSPHIGHO2_12_FULL_36_30]HLB56636.1 rod shape-determining protein MreC [Coxiellaceae bacterium]
MFHTGSGPGLRAFIFLILSIALLITDQRSVAFHSFRTRVSSTVAYPFEWLVDAPIRFTQWVNESVTTQNHLLHENEELKVRQILLQSRLQKLLSLEKENAQLRQLLQSTAEISGKVAVARLLAVSLDPNLQQVVLNKGSDAKVYRGQPVLDAFGVMGQVIAVGALTSKILLITDKQSAVPVEDYRTGMRALAVGMGTSGQLKLMDVPNQNNIQPGDLFVTSGLGLCYPIGYPVGVVTKLAHRKNNLSEKIILSPTAHLDQTEQVLLAWPNKTKLSVAVKKELQATLSSKKKNKKLVMKK